MFIFLLSITALQLPFVLVDFTDSNAFNDWKIVNDGVMGGKSEATFSKGPNKTALFKGEVSLQNNGGFTSVRQSFQTKDIAGSTKVFIRLKGDGKKYQFRVKNEQNERHAYKAEFSTSGKWQTVVIQLKDMEPTFRGFRPDIPNYTAEKLSEIGFLIANKKEEAFELCLSKIWLE
jgi:hypothetical protein